MTRFTASVIPLLIVLMGCDSKEETPQSAKTAPAAAIVVEAPGEATPQRAPKQSNRPQEEDTKGYYYSYEKEREADVEEDEYRSRVDAARNIRSPYERVRLDLLKGRLSKRFFQLCSACHDDYANGIIGPSLLTKNAEEIYQMTMDYKTQQKHNVLMKDLVANLKEEELRDIAKEIAAFNKAIRDMHQKGESQ